MRKTQRVGAKGKGTSHGTRHGTCQRTRQATRDPSPQGFLGPPRATIPRELRRVRAPRAPWRLQEPPGPCWDTQVPQVMQNKRFARDILEYSARIRERARAKSTFHSFLCPGRGSGPRYLARILRNTRCGGCAIRERARAKSTICCFVVSQSGLRTS